MVTTPVTLLENLINAPSQQLWSEFYSVYWKAILIFCSKQGLRPSDARDVLQESMLTLFKHLNNGGFQYDTKKGKFRNYLFVIVRNKATDAYRRGKIRETISLGALQEKGAVLQKISEKFNKM